MKLRFLLGNEPYGATSPLDISKDIIMTKKWSTPAMLSTELSTYHLILLYYLRRIIEEDLLMKNQRNTRKLKLISNTEGKNNH
jgi:hypothetical protein